MIAIYLQSSIPCFQPTDAQVDSLRSMLKDCVHLRTAGKTPPEVVLCRSEADFLSALPTAMQVIVWTFRQEWFDLAPMLRDVFTPAAGRDYFRVIPPPSVTMHYGAFHGAIMGETALAGVLSASHGILQFSNAMRSSDGTSAESSWPNLAIEAKAHRLAGSTILILGFGAIGRTFAKMAAQFAPKIIGVTRTPHPGLATDFPDATISTVEQLDLLLPKADHVVCFLPSGKDTDNLLDARRIALIKPTAFLYNYGRGNSIDETALAEALNEGRLAGAVLDVFKTEPLPPSSPLRRAKNCWLFPHASAFSPDYLNLYFASIVPQL